MRPWHRARKFQNTDHKGLLVVGVGCASRLTCSGWFQRLLSVLSSLCPVQSQMEFSISALSIQEPGSGPASDPRQPSKAAQGSQALRPPQGSKSSSLDALGPARKEEEASFWKINAERSRGEGPEAEFPSLTPSQIKSMEKGEKVLPACYRQDPAPKDREAKAERPGHLRPEPRALPGAAVESEGPQPVQASASTVEEVAPSQPAGKQPSPVASPGDRDDMEDELFSEPAPIQVGCPPGGTWMFPPLGCWESRCCERGCASNCLGSCFSPAGCIPLRLLGPVVIPQWSHRFTFLRARGLVLLILTNACGFSHFGQQSSYCHLSHCGSDWCV